MGTTLATPVQALSPASVNQIAGAAIRANSVKKRIQLNPITVVPANTPTVQIPLQNVGLLRGILVKCTATVGNTDGANNTVVSDFGPANMWSQITFNDFANITRIQTTGAHLFMIDCARRRGIMAAAYTNDNPGKFGANWTPIQAAPIAHGASGTVQSYHYIPVAYGDNDFRGAIFSNLTNASQSINLTFNPTVSVPTGTDSVNAIFGGVATANVTITSATITVYQDIWDQLPDYRSLPPGVSPAQWQASTGDLSGLLLPTWAMRFMYELKNSSFGQIAAGSENVFPYTNQRQFLSTIAQYNNGSGTPRALGTDINYWRLVAANSYETWKMDPTTVAVEARRILSDDFPPGFYYFDSRERPINTVVNGNLQLVVNPITATAPGASATIFTEDFALTSTITGASSFAGGN